MNANLIKAIIGMVTLLLLVGACDHIPALSGSGNLIRETRKVIGFSAVEFDGAGNVAIIQDGTEAIVIETDDDVMEHVTTEVREGTLYVGRDLVSPAPTRMNVILHVNELDHISIPGTWNVRCESLEADRLAIKIGGIGTILIRRFTADELAMVVEGTGVVEIAGEVISQTILVSGKVMTYRAGDLQSKTATIVVAGAGEFILWVTDTLDMKIEGSCIVDYYANPLIRIGKSDACEIHNLGDKESHDM